MSGRAITVLLVEDNPGDVLLVRRGLAAAPGGPFHLECADRLATGVSRLLEGGIDVLLLDLGLPDSQGLATLREFQERQPRVPVVVLSGAADEQLAMEAVQAGAQDYLVKGAESLQVLTRALRYAIERKRAQEQVYRLWLEAQASLREKEVLLQEVHHRVKNNLQVISSLINMQARTLRAGPSRAALEECRSRVMAIALIHEKLYQARDYAHVPFSAYARSLAANIFHATGTSPEKLELIVEIENVLLPVDKALPCGLILNELITNAVKHAFPNDGQGTVRVQLRSAGGGEIEFLVADNGVGMDPGFDPATSDSLGILLVKGLVEQLDGHLDILREAGTTFRIRFPLERPA